MGALANPEVGQYLNEHFVCAFQKMGTFRVVDGQKQGGNVVSYFALPGGAVLHAVAGPVDAAALLREARWVVETRKMGIARSQGSIDRYKSFWADAHAERLQSEHGIAMESKHQPRNTHGKSAMARMTRRDPAAPSLNLQGQVHTLLAQKPLPNLEQIADVVFERILREPVSTLPVAVN